MVWEWLWPNSSEGVRLSATREIALNFASVTLSTGFVAEDFCEIEVQKGDWLHDIGRRYNVDVRSLLKANPNIFNPNSLKVGTRIKVPCPPTVIGTTPQSDVSGRASLSTGIDPGMSNLPTKAVVSLGHPPEIFTLSKALVLLSQVLWKKEREYKVVEGDNLEWLAEKFGTSVKSIKKLNNLQDDVICTGSILKIERSRAFEQRMSLGRKASVPERNAAVEGVRIDTFLKTPLSFNPIFKVRLPVLKNKNLKSLTPKTVKVQYGDTLADIAYTNGLTIRELQRLNHLRDDVIFEGDVLAVSSGPSKMDPADLRPGRRRTNRPLFSRQVLGGLGVGGPKQLARSESFKGGLKTEGRWKRRKKGFQVEEKWMRFTAPLTEGFVSSPFGWRWGAFHEGVDLAADQGTPILASDKGTVTFAGWSGGYGYLIAIQHEGGFITRYAHCCSIHARVGQQVARGQHVAAVGSTGRSSGPHLHFEVRRNGEALDPFHWVYL
ncbi:lipoprotein NlpD [Marchantia polymorpha subsp. ruderalis]|uniref:LysM domain-containing protein n=2 Tax=Marchantia polymorpha TaxID=3197 RepID=A0A176WFC2_MARPO|nr:hypothetical protein AXG93_4510s1070 [Marchantia polymorpha subsp. ruderalis]PTQ47504.1 hypothetical protein MARPO_0008s0249 [Marchantia polymorpha]BBN19330.1 hypothetical protein Mp_8g09720 [Marchantia polymorpha subsp. ruderalis]|eukprot:PTQ47504.1 hypothetical protein MARPO_0008s0249 [Marchantia polymorpha]